MIWLDSRIGVCVAGGGSWNGIWEHLMESPGCQGEDFENSLILRRC